MPWQIMRLWKMILPIFWSLTPLLLPPLPVWSEPLVQTEQSLLPRLEFKPPARGAPGERSDSGSRSPAGCSSLVALVPENNFGLTTSERPTFWLYAHSIDKTPMTVDFLLRIPRADGEDSIYETTLQIPHESGIISFQLPEDAPPLSEGQQYHWYFLCDVIARHGWIERVPLTNTLQQQLQTATPRERIILLAEQGLWFDTLTELAQLRRADPNHPQWSADWETLLKHPAVRLEQILREPLVQCCPADSF